MEMLYVVAGWDWCTSSCFCLLVMEASLLGLGFVDASLPLESAAEALWKVLWKAGGKKK
jgi:hypothetical protein